MGSDMHFYAQEVAARSHGGLMQACKKAREVIAKLGPEHAALLKEIDQAINNGTIR